MRWEHYQLYVKTREALAAVPGYFRSDTIIAGIEATDIHTLASALGATIEDQVVSTLNLMRKVWDSDNNYPLHRFIRQSQTFPDVVFARTEEGNIVDVLLGIELKGWFLLAKEGEPNYRFKVSSDACNPWDLIVVVPWCLSQVISGRPVIFSPWIEQAQFAARRRNWWWQYERDADGSSTEIKLAKEINPYPAKKKKINDEAVADTGRNFGRIARVGIMEQYLETMSSLPVCGIHAGHWVQFFKAFAENKSEAKIRKALANLRGKLIADSALDSERASEDSVLGQLVAALGPLAGDDGDE